MVDEEDNTLEVVSLLPGLITGPVFLTNDFTSKEAIQVLLEEKYPLWPEIYVACIDVRDCAIAHLKALYCKKNMKVALVNGQFSLAEMATIVNNEFSQYGYKVARRQMYPWVAKLASFFNAEMREIIPLYGKETKIENQKAIKELEMEFTSIEKSIIDMSYSLIKQ
eukprot:CAMPEP_0205801774 /NCGR_PEP_ID=MMETSP0205-20121125/3878_1 /ASSEMBLY_ACC=CAM_ASM_000278 /TAXON_ID=36767 /ORGANISM="Euplotes focardii, Strain TN1" /LENGTH=165 /DNA_ID=CAMNT_0053067089 /DNA_START=414 /DNA_END=908 /DNA_ORIENTATION=-